MRRFYQKHHQQFDRIDYLLLQNPVLERGLTIAPVIVAGNTVKNGLALGLAFCVITVVTILLTALIPKRLPYTLRVICNALAASLVFIPTAMLAERLLPGSTFNLGIYLPLLVTNSLIVQKSDSRYHKLPPKEMLLQLCCTAMGFFVVIMTVSALRELLAYGTLMSKPVQWVSFTVPAVSLPFGGFILTGLLSAAVQALRLWLTAPGKPRTAEKEAGV